MDVSRRPPKSETDLAALYKRRERVLLLISALERYRVRRSVSYKRARGRSRRPPPEVECAE
jgi:hypothetical protein